ncbi:MAG TPA: primosomal protein N' [Candidatus Pristimantibacillus sp.]|nr:primosomal protein N' [Candidatus Pristimantibacillus sp.]
MWYVEVFVASAAYHKAAPLTYSTGQKLAAGSIVAVPLRQKTVLGFVAAVVPRPEFAAKEIGEVMDLPPLPAALRKLHSWLLTYYPAPSGIITQLFLPSGIAKKALEQPTTNVLTKGLPALTPDQEQAVQSLAGPGLHILHGETGSGKTRVYLELARKALEAGRSSIILTPEIGLTSQLAATFQATFGSRVLIVHSGLTESVRNQSWQWAAKQAELNEPVIIIGARSGLFSPLSNVGLIVIDESHETAYKQDQAPYYHAATVAAKLAALHQATLVLGSATPLISDYFIAEAKGRQIVRMTQLAASNLPQESQESIVVDLKDRSQFSKSSYLSEALLKAMRQTLAKHEQVLLFLNRRGTARVIFCQNCTWQATCPRCDLPLVYHGDHHTMRCHSCSYRDKVPTSCPQCQSADIIFKSIGTKAITDEVKRLFPESKVMRFDTDNRKDERLEANYHTVHSGDVDVIVGTQTLAKGLDLPKLGLVGIIIADTGLYFPDFSAQERTFQLLSQVLGRVGRGHRAGTTVIQTYSPDSPLLQSAITKNWSTFYNTELDERRRFLFPPFCYLLKLTCKRATSESAQKTAQHFADQLRSQNNNITIEGPAPAFHEKSENKFAWQLIVKAKRREQLTAIINHLPSGWSYDIDPMNLL